MSESDLWYWRARAEDAEARVESLEQVIEEMETEAKDVVGYWARQLRTALVSVSRSQQEPK